MTFAPLALTSDLAARNIAVPSGFDAVELLATASDVIREAAGCPITQTTSIVPLVGDDSQYLDLPGVPVSSVASVSLDGIGLTDWRLEDTALYRACGWLRHETYTATYTHGLPIIPRDIVDLACALAAMALTGAGGGYGNFGITQADHIGDAGESFFVPAGGSLVTPVSLPDRVRDRLRARFGTSAVTVGFRR